MVICDEKDKYFIRKRFLSINNPYKIMLFKQQPTSEFPKWEILSIKFGYVAYFSETGIGHFFLFNVRREAGPITC